MIKSLRIWTKILAVAGFLLIILALSVGFSIGPDNLCADNEGHVLLPWYLGLAALSPAAISLAAKIVERMIYSATYQVAKAIQDAKKKGPK